MHIESLKIKVRAEDKYQHSYNQEDLQQTVSNNTIIFNLQQSAAYGRNEM